MYYLKNWSFFIFSLSLWSIYSCVNYDDDCDYFLGGLPRGLLSLSFLVFRLIAFDILLLATTDKDLLSLGLPLLGVIDVSKLAFLRLFV